MISERLQRLVEEMVERGVQFEDAVHEFAQPLGFAVTQPQHIARSSRAGGGPCNDSFERNVTQPVQQFRE